MIENLIVENTVIGSAIILINLIPLITKKYKYIALTSVISLLLYLLVSALK